MRTHVLVLDDNACSFEHLLLTICPCQAKNEDVWCVSFHSVATYVRTIPWWLLFTMYHTTHSLSSTSHNQRLPRCCHRFKFLLEPLFYQLFSKDIVMCHNSQFSFGAIFLSRTLPYHTFGKPLYIMCKMMYRGKGQSTNNQPVTVIQNLLDTQTLIRLTFKSLFKLLSQ